MSEPTEDVHRWIPNEYADDNGYVWCQVCGRGQGSYLHATAVSDPTEDTPLRYDAPRYTRLTPDYGKPASDPVEDGDLLARMGTDGQKWAQEFIARFGGDEGLMIGWFANAIEAGRDAGRAAAVQAERERIRAVIDDGLPREWFDVKAAVLAVIDGASDE